MENEIWKDIPGYEGHYMVSNMGRIKNKKGQFLTPQYIRGYYRVKLTLKKPIMRFIHRLVWEAFNGQIPECYQINHLNENKSDNRLENLSLCTPKENINYGTCIKRRSSKVSKSIIQLDKNGNFIKEWLSSSEIEKNTGFKSSHIRSCCCNLIPSAYGYIWKHKNEKPEVQ